MLEPTTMLQNIVNLKERVKDNFFITDFFFAFENWPCSAILSLTTYLWLKTHCENVFQNLLLNKYSNRLTSFQFTLL